MTATQGTTTAATTAAPTSIRLAVIAGDGIGPEVVAEGLQVLEAALGNDATVTTTSYDLGAKRWHATGETLPDAALGGATLTAAARRRPRRPNPP